MAALDTAMAAALLAMVANLTIGRQRYAHVQEEVVRIRERALALQQDARMLVDEDARAYGRVAEAMSLPKGTDEEKEARAARLQEALKAAVRPPLRTMRIASQVIQLAAELVGIGNQSAVSDVGTSVVTARAGYHAARLNVDINIHSISDPHWVEDIRREVREIALPDTLEREVMERTERIIRREV